MRFLADKGDSNCRVYGGIMEKKTAIVTGGSSGIGLCTARDLVKEGYTVFDLSRHGTDRDGILHIDCDVTDENAVKEAVDRIVSGQGRIDAVVNCAGFGISGAIECTSPEAAKKQFDVNFFGMVNVNRCCIPEIRKTKGTIVNISSVAACAPIPFQAFYSASKAAINSYSLCLANELRPYGVKIVSVMPGDTATGFTDAREKESSGDDIYAGRISRSVQKMESDERGGMSPERAGAFITSVVTGKSRKPLRTIGLQYKLAVFLLKILPASLSNRLLGFIYAS